MTSPFLINRQAVLLCLLMIPLLFSCQSKQLSGPQQTSPTGKEVVLKIEPGEDNPRNSEGDFITLKDGRMLFVYSRYTGNSTSDHAPAFLAGRFSEDGGKTWQQEDQTIVEREGDMNVMSVSLLRLQNGAIALFYLRKNSTSDCIPMLRISKDEAKTWSAATPCITDQKGYFVLNNGRVIQLANGRLLMPVSRHKAPDTEWSNTGRIWNYYSDDNGQNWTASAEVPNPGGIDLQEPGVVALKDGRIMMFLRNGSGVQYLSFSENDGMSWSPAEASQIKSPRSPASIERIPATGDLLLVWNNNGGEIEELKGRRTPFNIALSRDEGKSWEHIKTIEDDPDGWYCYTAIHFSGRYVLLGHCAGNRPLGASLSVTNITRLSLDWIYE